MGRRANPQRGQRWLTLAVFIAVILAGLGFVAYGFFGQQAASAPIPDKFFSSTDADTYVPTTNTFQVSPTGPLIAVPSLGLEAGLIATGAKDGFLVLPDPPQATWYEKTVALGAKNGRTLIASHVDSGHGDAAPFSRLHKIEKGAPIMVRDFEGTMHEYKATSIKVYERQRVPDELFRSTGKHELVLVTCSGPTINSGEASYYMYNLVVAAEPLE